MKKSSKIILWICSKFSRDEILNILTGLIKILLDNNSESKFKKTFKEDHPNYRKFIVDSKPPLTEVEIENQYEQSIKNYILLLKEHQDKTGKILKPIKHRDKSKAVPETTICPHCSAPHNYIYYNDGKKRTQLVCKICSSTFQLNRRYKLNKTKYYCPYCKRALYWWKERKEVTMYKCHNKSCKHRIRAINMLNSAELKAHKKGSSQYKVNYQYREYHYDIEKLNHSEPLKPRVDITKIHNSVHVLSLVLTFHISYALDASKTARILTDIFNIQISRQTVLNYAEAAAHSCHQFNLDNKGEIDDISAGDETYIKVRGKHKYVWFFISPEKKSITSYHVADTRNTKDAIIAMLEAKRTATSEQILTYITDGNPSYQAGIHYINALEKNKNKLQYKKVVGLQNLDDESTKYRRFKQIIERLNRTYKHHNTGEGFRTMNGAIALTTLFVTHYNFIRSHSTLFNNVPIELNELKDLSSTPEKWGKILSMVS